MKNLFRRITFVLIIGLALFLAGRTFMRSRASLGADFSAFLPLIVVPERIGLEPIGPSGGLIVSLAINPQDDQILYAGTWGAGVYKSTDGGVTWQESSTGLIDGYIQSLTIDPQNPNNLYAGMYGYGVYKTVDGGVTWQATGPGLSSQAIVYALVIDPTRPNILFAGTRDRAFSGPKWGGGVYRTENAGQSWTAVNDGLVEDWVYGLAIDPQRPDLIYTALHTEGVYRSGNGGKNWFWLNSGLDDSSARTFAINPFNTPEIYVGTWHGDSIYRSLDGGGLWRIWNDGMYGAQIYDLEIDPANPTVLYAATYFRGVKKTVNGGDKWFDSGLSPNFVYRIKVSPQNPQTVFAGTRGGGLYKSSDAGANWKQSHAGINNAWVTSVIANAPEQALISVIGGGVYSTTNAGKSWDWLGVGLLDNFITFVERSPYNPQILYAGSENSGFYISFDGGKYWQQRNGGMDEQISSAQAQPLAEAPFVEDHLRDSRGLKLDSDITITALSLAIHPIFPETMFIGTANGLYFTNNDGITWYKNSELGGRDIYDICYDPNNLQRILVATDGGSSGSLLITEDGNKDWDPRNTGLGGASVYVVEADPYTANKFYVGTNTGMYVSVDGGYNWSLYGLGGMVIRTIAQPLPGEIYVGTDTGLYRQLNGGAWENLHDGMRNDRTKILDLAFAPDGKAFYLATEAYGVYIHTPTQPK
jgi:photosystem II stability/assembly factor-like uncharacterized protein